MHEGLLPVFSSFPLVLAVVDPLALRCLMSVPLVEPEDIVTSATTAPVGGITAIGAMVTFGEGNEEGLTRS